jgi:cellulose biosynthesis protein BcsQ
MLWSRKNIKFDDNIYDWRNFLQLKTSAAEASGWGDLNVLLREGKKSGDKILQSLQPIRKILDSYKLLSKVVCVISFKGGVGKTTYICNLALNLTRKGARVLIIDGDAGMPDVSLALNHKIAKANKLFHYCYDTGRRNYLLDVYNLTGAGAGLALSDLALVDDPVKLTEAYCKFFVSHIHKLNYDIILLDSGGGSLSTLLPVAALSTNIITLYTTEPPSREKLWQTIFNIAVRLDGKYYYPVYADLERPRALPILRGISPADQKEVQNQMKDVLSETFEPLFRPPYRAQSKIFLNKQNLIGYDPLLGQTPLLAHPKHSSQGIDFMANTLISTLGIKTTKTGIIDYGKYEIEE